jgi:polysaccharide export outer membrane protein
MRAIPIITLSLGPLGLLLAQGLSSGEQAKPDSPSSTPLTEFDAKPDAIDQVVAEEPPIPSPLEITPIPEFSFNQPSLEVPPTPRLMAPVTKNKTAYPPLPTSVPEVSSDLLDRIVNRTVTNQSVAVARSQPPANPLVSPSQQEAQAKPEQVTPVAQPASAQPSSQVGTAEPDNTIAVAATSPEGTAQPLPQQGGLPNLGLSPANDGELIALADAPPVVQVAIADIGQSVALFELADAANEEPAVDAEVADGEATNVEAASVEVADAEATSVEAAAVEIASAEVDSGNGVDSIAPGSDNILEQTVQATEVAPSENAATESIAAENTQVESNRTASSAQFVNAIAPETMQAPEFTVAQAAPPAGFESINETYVLGPGDSIQIDLFNVPEYSGQQQILVDGTVNLPLVGRLPLAGLTIRQAEETISARYASELEYSIATVSLLQPRALRVALAGEIAQPGLYTLASSEGGQFPTVVQAIQTAGGTTQAADLRQVQVRRRDQNGATRTFNVNLQELLRTGDVTQNTSLRDGDTVFIPPTAEINLADSSQLAVSNLRSSTDQPVTVAIVGEVAQPGPYRLGGEGGQPTLIQTIQQAGGFTPAADLRQIEVRRQTRQGSEQVITLNLWDVLQTGDLAQDVVLQQGDRITIPTATVASEEAFALASSTLSTGAIQVNIIGEVRSPGALELRANSTLNQAVLAAGGFNGRANRKNITLIRFNPNGTVTQQELELDLSEGLNPENNPLLNNNDVILVGRSTGAQITDTLSTILGVFRLLTPFGLPLP